MQVENFDSALRVHTIRNDNSFPIQCKSTLEANHPKMIEHEEYKSFLLLPQETKIVPHEYFSYVVLDQKLMLDTARQTLPIKITHGLLPHGFSQTIRYNLR